MSADDSKKPLSSNSNPCEGLYSMAKDTNKVGETSEQVLEENDEHNNDERAALDSFDALIAKSSDVGEYKNESKETKASTLSSCPVPLPHHDNLEFRQPRGPARPTVNLARLRSSNSGAPKIHLGDLGAFSAALERAPSPHTRQMLHQRRPAVLSRALTDRVPLVNRRGGNPGLWDHEEMAKETFGHY